MKKLAILLLLPLLGCATSKQASKDVKLAAPVTEGAAPAQPEISKRAQLYFEDAVKAWEAQKKANAYDYPSLERKFQQALEADKAFAEAEYNLGVLAERQGRLDDAVARYRAALQKKPTLRQAAENLAVISQNRGDLAGAIALYREILTKYPEDASSRSRLAEIYRRQGDHDKAMEFAREALMRDAKLLRAYKVMMRSYLDRKQLAMAKLVALRAMKIDEADPELYHTVGLILLAEKEIEQARLQFNKALAVRSDYLPSHVELARLSMSVEDYTAAEGHLRRILQADGKNAEAHLLLGVAYKGLGQYDKAMIEYDEAERLNPQLAAVFLNRAIILHRHKDAPERALELYRKYLSLSGEGIVRADSPVLGLVREAEALAQAKAEAAAMEAQMKREQELLEKQQAAQGDVQPASGTAGSPEAAPAHPEPSAAGAEPSGAEPEDDLGEPEDDM